MAGKVQIPQASIFTSDPLEQIFAKGVSDRDMSGLNYMFLNAFGGRREADQQTYLAGVQAANQLALREAQNEQVTKLMEQAMKSGTELAGKGYETGEMPIMSQIFRDPKNQNVVAALIRDKLAAEAAKDRASAATAGADNTQVRTEIMPGGTASTIITTKGNDAQARANAAAERQRAEIARLRQAGAPIVSDATARTGSNFGPVR